MAQATPIMTLDPPQRLGRLLVVDDDPEIIAMVTDYFTASGFEVIAAQHGGDGLMLADVEHPDVVILDIKMPGMSGVEVLQQLRIRWPDLGSPVR